MAMKLKAVEVHTCAVGEDEHGARIIIWDGSTRWRDDDDSLTLVGWCNVMVLELAGEQHHLLLSGDAT